MILNKAKWQTCCLLFLAAVMLSACGKSGGADSKDSGNSAFPGYYGSAGLANLPNGPVLANMSGNNVMPLTVNGSLCSAATSNGYINKPCVSVTICDTSGNNCTTINDILLDTGSYGLRVFNSAIKQQNPQLAAALSPIQHGGANVAECVSFLDTSADWGPVEMANIVLANEPAVQVPIHVIDSTFANASAKSCPNANTDPVDAGYNGVLGVGLFAQDCGADCSAADGLYFTCNGTSCTAFAPTLAEQVTNPVSALPLDNNGVVIELPSLVQGGQLEANGYVVLGIGTQSNNIPGNVKSYAADPKYGEFLTSFGGAAYSASFLDSGSNTFGFNPSPSVSSQLPDCGSDAPGYFCPANTLTFSANTISYDGVTFSSDSFLVGNALNLANTGNNVFMEIATTMNGSTQSFDWGMPFFYGRNIYVGIEGRSSRLGAGPYWAY